MTDLATLLAAATLTLGPLRAKGVAAVILALAVAAALLFRSRLCLGLPAFGAALPEAVHQLLR